MAEYLPQHLNRQGPVIDLNAITTYVDRDIELARQMGG